MHGFWWKEDHLEDLAIDGRKTWKWILKK